MLQQILSELESTPTQLVAVSKTKTPEQVLKIYEQGHRKFGENKALEMQAKYELLPKDIQWHFIGHLQTNKIKYIASFVNVIHAVDSLNLLKAIDKEAKKRDRVIDCLLQFHIADEQSKYGMDMEACVQLLKEPTLPSLKNVRIVGVMGMATFTSDQSQVRTEFQVLSRAFKTLKHSFFQENPEFKEISMGMSGDYKIAVEEGSTLVRIGSLIFRN